MLGKKKYTPILPAPGQGGRSWAGEEGGSPVQLGGALPPKRQKRAGRFACDACRSKKSAVRTSSSFSLALYWRDGSGLTLWVS